MSSTSTENNTTEEIFEENTTTEEFEEHLEVFTTMMKQSYVMDDKGEPIDLPEDQLSQVENIVQTTRNLVTESFRPLFLSREKQIADNQVTIEYLQQQIAEKRANLGLPAHASTSSTSAMSQTCPVDLGLNDGELPSVDWLIANRKSKGTAPLNGYNIFTIYHMAKLKADNQKASFPIKGVWETQNKPAWAALAVQFNAKIASTNPAALKAASNPGLPVGVPIDLPETKGHGKNVTGYNLYTSQWKKENPKGGNFPPKGSWDLLPEDVRSHYKAQAEALKAQRA